MLSLEVTAVLCEVSWTTCSMSSPLAVLLLLFLVIVTWGNGCTGGDSSVVQSQLKNVQQIQASRGAFAAILGDGSVVTWGLASHGGDSSSAG